MPEELYETPREQPSQADIVEFLPHIFLDSPLYALNKEDESKFTASIHPFASFDDKNGQAVLATCKRQKAILLSNDCEIDKPHVLRWIVSPVVPILKLGTENRDRVRRNRVYAMFHLPRYHDVLEESFVDFNQATTLNTEIVKAGHRIVSLSDAGRQGLYAQFIRWFTRWELRSMHCPSCGVEFDPSHVMPVRPQ